MKDNRAAGELEGERSGGAVVNDMPGACQSRGVTEPQREKGPARNQTRAIKNVRYGLFDERSEIFRENLF